MNLGIEYLIRSGVAKDLLEFPCSLFLEQQRNKKVIVIDKPRRLGRSVQNNYSAILPTYSVKHWDIFLCESKSALPPMDELKVKKIQDISTAGFSSLKYFGQPIPANKNSWRHPMSQQVYEEYYNQFTSSFLHMAIKRCWLWAAFMNVYQIIDKSLSSSLEYLPEHLRMFEEQRCVSKKHPLKWKFWEMWCKHMLVENENIATELAFSTI